MRNHASVVLCAAAAFLLVLLIDVALGSQVAFRGTIESRRMGITDGWDTFTVSVRPADEIARVETLDVPVRYDEYWAAQVGREVTVGFRRGLITGHYYGIYVVVGHRT